MAISLRSLIRSPSHPGSLFRKDWVVYSKPPFGRPEHVLRYLGNYIHRVAISNHRLLAVADGRVIFRWRDSAHGNRKRVMALPVDEFLRRFLLHVLPRGFVRIRNFGFLANRRRAELLPLCFRLLRIQPNTQGARRRRPRSPLIRYASAPSVAGPCMLSSDSPAHNSSYDLRLILVGAQHEVTSPASAFLAQWHAQPLLASFFSDPDLAYSSRSSDVYCHGVSRYQCPLVCQRTGCRAPSHTNQNRLSRIQIP
jgi:putative transposase